MRESKEEMEMVKAEGTLPSYLESKGKREEKCFQSYKIQFMQPYNQGSLSIHDFGALSGLP